MRTERKRNITNHLNCPDSDCDLHYRKVDRANNTDDLANGSLRELPVCFKEHKCF